MDSEAMAENRWGFIPYWLERKAWWERFLPLVYLVGLAAAVAMESEALMDYFSFSKLAVYEYFEVEVALSVIPYATAAWLTGWLRRIGLAVAGEWWSEVV